MTEKKIVITREMFLDVVEQLIAEGTVPTVLKIVIYKTIGVCTRLHHQAQAVRLPAQGLPCSLLGQAKSSGKRSLAR
jgi:hypothetical protein